MANPPDSLQLALHHQKEGRLDQAEQVYRRLLEQQPDYVDALNLLGALIYQQGRFHEAVSCFEQVLILQPDNPDSYNSMGVVLKGQGNAEAAATYYRQALALRPDQPEVHNNLGNALWQLGDLEAAIAAYEQALTLYPAYPEAHNNLGSILKDLGRLEEAVAHLQTAIALKPDYVEALHNLGATLQRQGKLAETLDIYRQALAIKPNAPDICNSLGNVLQQQGEFEAAIAYHQQAIALKPDYPEAFHSLANACQQQKQLELAITYYQQALTLRPEYPEALSNYGNALQEQGKLNEAIAQYRQALTIRPHFAEAHSNLGAALKEQKQYDQAIAHFQEAIALRPDYAEVYNNLGNVYQEQDNIDEAIVCYRKALELKPDFAEIHSNLGNMLQHQGEFEAAFDHFQQAIAVQPNYAGAYNNLGIALRNHGQVEAAFQAYAKAIELDPDFVEAHWNNALNYLLTGDLQAGFAEYEWRFKWSKFQQQSPPRPYPQPRWDGAPLAGKTIFLYAEQGLGDTIQFGRYISLVAERGGRVILECQPQLISLLQSLPAIQQIIPQGSPPPQFDVHAPLLSLPFIFGTTLETVPATVPYVPAPVPPFPTLPGAIAGSFKVGIVWSGNPDNPYNRTRAVPLELLLPLAEMPGIQLYSLQKQLPPSDQPILEAHPEVLDLREQLTDFVATAALIEQLDLVISVDTAVTHLAGARAKSVWLLLPFAPDWRWLCDRSDSPWYPTLRLFRQSAYGDWTDVMEQVQQALAVLTGNPLPTSPSKPQHTQPQKIRSPISGKLAKKPGKKQDKAVKPLRTAAVSVAPSATAPAAPAAPPLPAELKAAVRLHQAGKVQDAARVCRQFLQQQDHPEGWHMLGLMAHQNRDFETAIAHYQKVLAINPHHHDTCNNLAVAFHELERLEDAIVYYQRALAIKPDYADAHNNYANALRATGKMEDAIHHYRLAIAHRPHYPDAYNNLGLAYYGQEDFAQAAECYRQAIAQRPDFAQAHNHLGNALKELGDFTTAAHHYEQAIALKPDYAKAFNNWGNIFRDSGDLKTATEYYNRAIGIDANFAEAHWNQALTLLIGGDLGPGFAEYEWRWRVKLPTFQPMRSFTAPLWDGSPLNGKTIFLHAEQGMGDIIQFVRYVALVVERGGRVILECHPPLINLLKTIPGVQQIVSYGSSPPPFQVHAPLLSLPHILGTTLATVPAQVPYLQVADTGLRLPEARVMNHPNPLKIGIVWSGNPENPYNRSRACPLAALLSLTDMPGLQFYSLQKDLQPTDQEQLQAHPDVIDLREQLTDFVHTAELINQLDLVISVDTAVTHLVGALGQPVWLLLPFAPDWRWLLERQDSPWYPTMRLFRQPTFGDWDSVLEQLREALWEKAGVEKPIARKPTNRKSASKVAPPQLPMRPIPAFDVNPLIQQALQHYSNGQLAETEQVCRQILRHDPDHVDTLNILGVVLARLGQAEAAIAPLQRVLQLDPESTDAWCNLGNALKERGRLPEAVTHYQRAIALKPDHTDAMHNLTVVLQELDRLEEAFTCCEQVLALEPHSRNAHYSFGYIQRRLGRLDGAIASYRRAIQLAPNYPEAHKNLGHALLLKGDLVNGFAEYEWRWQQKGWAPRPFTQPLWDGSPLVGQTILLHAEQGMGDTIQFIRYARLVKERGGRVVVECPRSLIRLLQTHPDVDQLIPQDSPLPAFDVHAPLLSLPHILGTTLETIPAAVPYLHPPERLELEDTNHFKVGIVWSGNPDHRNNHLRSCQLEHFRVLQDIPGIRFYSLQKGPAATDLQTVTGLPLQDWSERLQDFADTAAAIAQLDLVITVDTAVAHVAGALGRPVWLLLHHSPDWRWMLDRADTPWYPTMRLFRQAQLGDWQGVFEQVKVALGQVIVQRQSSTVASETVKPGNDTHPDQVTVGIGWQLGLVSDWGIWGVNLALQLWHDARFMPVVSEADAIAALPSLYRALLGTLPSPSIAAGKLVLQPLGDCFADLGALPAAITPNRMIGLVHAADTQFTPAAIAQAKTLAQVITGSTWNANILRQYGLDPIVMPLAGIDPSLFHSAPKAHLFGDRFVIFSGGIPSHIKGHDLLLAAFQAFHSRHADALLVTAWQSAADRIVATHGNGHHLTSDRSLHNELPAGVWIDLENLPYPEWGQVIREADVAVFPSRCEAGLNPWAIASLACGIPTLLSANTGNLDLIRHNVAYPLQYQRPVKNHPVVGGTAGWGESDIEEIVETLEHIYTHRQEARCRGAIAADVLKDWTWHNQLQPLLDLLLSIHQTQPNPAPSRSECYINTR